jgi:hypothetical protein
VEDRFGALVLFDPAAAPKRGLLPDLVDKVCIIYGGIGADLCISPQAFQQRRLFPPPHALSIDNILHILVYRHNRTE